MTRPLVGFLLFLLVGYVFFRSPVHYLSDSHYALLMDEAIIYHHSPNMISYDLQRVRAPSYTNHGYLWTIDMVKGRLLYVYPWGGPLLSLPLVAVFGAAGLKVAPHGVYSLSNELTIQVYLAAVLCALAVWAFFDMAATMLPMGWAATIALSAAFGTQLWSSASRNLWPQTWYIVLMSLSVWLLMKERGRPVLLGTMLAWACFCRPQGLPVALLVSIYLLVEYGWRCFLAYAMAGTLWGVVFGTMMLFFFGRLSPPIYQGGLSFPHEFLFRLAGILLSPSRGLLIFVPIVLLPGYLTFRYWSVLPRRRIVYLALAAITSYIVMTASWDDWWGGGSYGPRLLMDTIPWFVVLAVLGVRALLDDRGLAVVEGSALISVGFLLLVLSVAMNAAGAVSAATIAWNTDPAIDVNPQRVWDWQHPQFLAWASPLRYRTAGSAGTPEAHKAPSP